MRYALISIAFLSGLCDRELARLTRTARESFLSGLCDREH